MDRAIFFKDIHDLYCVRLISTSNVPILLYEPTGRQPSPLLSLPPERSLSEYIPSNNKQNIFLIRNIIYRYILLCRYIDIWQVYQHQILWKYISIIVSVCLSINQERYREGKHISTTK